MAAKKVYSEQVKSKLDELYKTPKDVKNRRAVLNLYDVDITFEKIVNTVKNQPFIKTCQKSSQLDLTGLDFGKIDECISSIVNLPKSKETAVIEMVKVCDFPQVDFLHSGIKTINNQKKFAAPRCIINLSGEKIDARLGVRINTGYIIKINTVEMGKAVQNGKIVDTKKGSQPEIIIIPQIVSKHDGIVQCLYGRDAEDTGLLTINFTTTKELDTSRPLHVVLNAYVVDRSLGIANIYNSESTTDLFKAKDNRTGRSIKNPKTKFVTPSFDTTSINGSLLLDTFDSTKTPSAPFKNQKIKIDNSIVLFTSRKREWCDPKMLTSIGIYNTNSKKHYPGLVIKDLDLDLKHNTHGMAFVKYKLTIFSIESGKTDKYYDCRILNGAFYDVPSYSDFNRDMRKVRSALIDLKKGAEICQSIVDKHAGKYTMNDLLRIFDYDRSINDDSRLAERITYDDERLYNERPAELNCYSLGLYKGLKSLAYQRCSDLFTDEQLKALSMTCSKAIDKTKRPSDDSGNGSNEVEAKRAKLE
ncbi:GrBNV gp22-like protein [Tomelloso virus]|uniref:GrBNV gp22-like protein n=1 Tax=Tomelloso virus TaxID=2053981 RepID=A0A2H4T2T1_9VIRU|nr:GrBNV gp22-like protein [Tomelloso virus]ATY70190.1 GrBNV gp22-like protein [Tomelloso virus]